MSTAANRNSSVAARRAGSHTPGAPPPVRQKMWLLKIVVITSVAVGADALVQSESSASGITGTAHADVGASRASLASAPHATGARPAARSLADRLRSMVRRGLAAVAQAEGDRSAPSKSKGCPVVSQFCTISSSMFSVDKEFKAGSSCLGTCYDKSKVGDEACQLAKKTIAGAESGSNFCYKPCLNMGIEFRSEKKAAKTYDAVIPHCSAGDKKWAALPADVDFIRGQKQQLAEDQVKIDKIMQMKFAA